MTDEKSHKRVILPPDLKRAEIVPKSKLTQIRSEAYAEIIEQDFDQNKVNYRLVYIHGVPVYVKVEQK